MAKNIQRVRPQGVILAHGIWRHGLGLKALGLLYMLLDLAELPDWEFTLEGLLGVSRQHGMGDGRDSIRTAISELEDHGFLVRDRDRSEAGQLGASQWWISDSPISEPAGIPAPASDSPASENPTLVNRLQEGSSSIEEEKTKKSPCKSPKRKAARDTTAKLAYHEEAIALWNRCAPAHWSRAQGLGRARKTALNTLANDFGGHQKALAALEESLAIAHRESWCMKAQTRLALENWLSNGKVRQHLEKHQALQEPAAACLSGEQQEMAELAAKHPALFDGVLLQDGCLHLRYTAAVQQQASYPAHGLITTMGALMAEITHLQERLQPVCPF